MPLRAAPLLLLLALLACGGSAPSAEIEVPVRVGSVAVDRNNAPVVILEEEGGPRLLPIWIGTAEATSIATEMNEQRPPRPNSHDFTKRVIQSLNASIDRVVVSDLRAGTYYATLFLQVGGRTVEIDVRPSDGIAVALRLDAPILVRERLFEALRDRLEFEDSGESI
jgi:bifunctional DNase/RNase